MRDRIRRHGQDWTLTRRDASTVDPQGLRRFEHFEEAERLARDLGDSTEGLDALRTNLAREDVARDLSAYTDDQIETEVAWQLTAQRIVVNAWRDASGGGGGGPPGPVGPVDPVDPVGPGEDKDTWIEIRMKNTEGVPMKGERYQLKLPDGTVREGTLNDAGAVRIEGIDPGMCALTFPDLDRRMAVRASEGGG
jgi:hypothetical protein